MRDYTSAWADATLRELGVADACIAALAAREQMPLGSPERDGATTVLAAIQQVWDQARIRTAEAQQTCEEVQP